jgi:hypothetical protein
MPKSGSSNTVPYRKEGKIMEKFNADAFWCFLFGVATGWWLLWAYMRGAFDDSRRQRRRRRRRNGWY